VKKNKNINRKYQRQAIKIRAIIIYKSRDIKSLDNTIDRENKKFQ
jgi:hypothetical protein